MFGALFSVLVCEDGVMEDESKSCVFGKIMNKKLFVNREDMCSGGRIWRYM